MPLGIHHPVWIEDPEFDLHWHMRHVEVPAPGGRLELAELVSELVALPLDRTRPLWEMWVIEGLEHGRIATLTKVHHSAIDGASGAELTVSLFDLSPEVAEVEPPEHEWTPDAEPNDVDLVSHAITSLMRQPWRVARASMRTAQTALKLRSNIRSGDLIPPPIPFTAPNTSINGALSGRRSYGTRTVSLDDAKFVKNTFGTTVNDVVLALCGGALRRYFDSHGEHLDRPLVAMVPMSVRSNDERDAMGNRVTSMLTSLATDIDDPVARLLAIHEGMRNAKHQTNAIGADLLTDWAEFAAPAVFSRAVRLYSRMHLANLHRPIFNVTISNVPGPPFPLYSAGAKLLANYPIGPIFDGGGLNMTVMSYLDHMDFGLLACPDLVDDVDALAQGVPDALDELVSAAKAHLEVAAAITEPVKRQIKTRPRPKAKAKAKKVPAT